MQLIPGPIMRHLLILLASSATGQVPIPTTCENAEKKLVIHSSSQSVSQNVCPMQLGRRVPNKGKKTGCTKHRVTH